jgi:hypothetical protein
VFLSHYYSSLIILAAKEAATLLGYDKKMWDGDKEPKLVEDSDWGDLTEEQKTAAGVLGYSADNWDDDDSSSSSSDSD